MVLTGPLGIFVDFDGTIATIASTPDEAVVSHRAAEALRRLASKLDLVCVVSGRAAGELRDKVMVDGVVYVGNHGVEYLDAGRLEVAPGAAGYREKIRLVLDHLRSNTDVPGLIWNDKDYSASVHYRLAEDAGNARRMLQASLDSLPASDDLDVFWGKMVLEIRAPIGLDKGYALRKLVRERQLGGAIVVGDDATDVDAMAALSDLRAKGGLRGAGIAVLHEDSPEELLGAADYALDGVPGVETFLEWLESAADERGRASA